MWRVLTVFFLTGCSSTGKTADDSGTPGAGDSDSTIPGGRPTVVSADAWCYFHKTGEQYYNWDAACVVDDPQGPESLTGGTLVVHQGDTEVASHLLACNHESGSCTTTFAEDLDGVLCADATSYRFQFTVTDEDGNASDPVEVVGRAE